MNSQKQILIAAALIAFLGVTACRKTSAPSEPSAPGSTADQERLHPESGVTAAVEIRFFKGSIGNALDLQMKLAREGERLTGSYFYQKIGTKIDLRGTVDKDGNLTLEEFDSNGKQTGVFKGLWKTDADGLIEIKGDWTKPNSDKKTTFSLLQEPIEFSNGVEIVSKQIREKNKKLKYEVDVAYPQLTGSVDPNFEKFNQTVRSLITKKVADFKKGMTPAADGEPTPDADNPGVDESMGSDIAVGYTVALAKDDLISLEFTVSDYEAGAAHPSSYTEVVNFDLKNGKLIKLADVFSPGAKYVQTLSTFCVQELKKQAKEQGDAFIDEDWIKRGAGPEVTNYANWTITKKGLGITFDPYQVASYAAGPQNVLVPYSAVKEIVKPDGPVGQFVK
jgi:hypothetical protein